MKLHKTLQKVDLDSFGLFTQRIVSAGYCLSEMETLLDSDVFVGDDYEIEDALDQVGCFIQRCCKYEGEGQLTLETAIEVIEDKLGETNE